jgi:hypothetical protein
VKIEGSAIGEITAGTQHRIRDCKLRKCLRHRSAAASWRDRQLSAGYGDSFRADAPVVACRALRLDRAFRVRGRSVIVGCHALLDRRKCEPYPYPFNCAQSTPTAVELLPNQGLMLRARPDRTLFAQGLVAGSFPSVFYFGNELEKCIAAVLVCSHPAAAFR